MSETFQLFPEMKTIERITLLLTGIPGKKEIII